MSSRARTRQVEKLTPHETRCAARPCARRPGEDTRKRWGRERTARFAGPRVSEVRAPPDTPGSARPGENQGHDDGGPSGLRLRLHRNAPGALPAQSPALPSPASLLDSSYPLWFVGNKLETRPYGNAGPPEEQEKIILTTLHSLESASRSGAGTRGDHWFPRPRATWLPPKLRFPPDTPKSTSQWNVRSVPPLPQRHFPQIRSKR